MPKVKKRPIFQSKKNQKNEFLIKKTMLINTLTHGKQDHPFTKIYKLYNQILTKSSHQQRQIQSGVAQ